MESEEIDCLQRCSDRLRDFSKPETAPRPQVARLEGAREVGKGW